jgi:iron complex outermembrane receptor protein
VKPATRQRRRWSPTPRSAVRHGLRLALASGLCAAQAQERPASSALPPVTVTGSHVAGLETEGPRPVQVITAEELARSGHSTLWQALATLTANGQGALSPNFSAASAIGASGLSLRGLGVGATLVLVDGRRTAPYPIGDDGQRGFVDISNIPLDTVERVEILKDGASAIYGSDAMAGVVNIVTRRSFVGRRLTAEGGSAQRGDGRSAYFAGLFGHGDLAADGHNFYIAGEIRRQGQIRFIDRGSLFNRTDFSAAGGFDTTPGVPNALNGQRPQSPTGYVTDADGAIVGFMPGCDAARFEAGRCSFRNTWSQIQPPREASSLSARYTQRLPDGWQLSLQGTHARSQSQQARRPAWAFTGGYQGIASGPGQAPTLLPALPPTTIGQGNPSYPAGATSPSGLLNYTFLDIGPKVDDSDARSSRLVAELQGRVGAWDLTAALGGSRVALDVVSSGLVNAARLQTALDDPANPYLVGGPNSPELLAWIAPRQRARSSSDLRFLQLTGSREVLRLPGGPLSLALGADFTHRSQHETPAADVAAGLVEASNRFVHGSQQVRSVYAETQAPLSERLSVSAALRHDAYSRSGGRSSPSLGVKYQPAGGVLLRAAASGGFRAPSPAENGLAGNTSSTGATRDPLLCPSAADANAPGNFPSQCAVEAAMMYGANPALKPETSRSFTFGVALEPARDLALSLDFYAIEIRDQIVLGNSPSAVRGSNLTPIGQVQADGTVRPVVPPVAPIAYYQVGYVNATSTRTTGVDLALAWRHRLSGIGTLRSNLALTYMNRYDLTIDGVTYRLAGTHGPILVSADTGSPKMRLRWSNTLERGDWSVTGTLNYIGSFSLTDPSLGVNDCVAGLGFGGAAEGHAEQLGAGVVPPGVSCKVRAFTTFDLSAHWRASPQLGLQFSVLNLFNAGAPADWGTYAGAGRPYNPTLHAQGAIGRSVSLRAVYTF